MRPKQSEPKPVKDAPRRLPTFGDIDEEAAFWDSHDSAEFEDEFEDAPDVRFVPAGDLSSAITVLLDPRTLGELRERARAAGTEPETLVREWILLNIWAPRRGRHHRADGPGTRRRRRE